MCPVCWGTAIASFGGILAASIASIAGDDRITLSIAVGLITIWLLDRCHMVTTPSWFVGVLTTVIVLRVLYLVVIRWDQLLIWRAWTAARKAASQVCPRNKGDFQVSDHSPERGAASSRAIGKRRDGFQVQPQRSE